MRQIAGMIRKRTGGPGLSDITGEAVRFVEGAGIETGLLTLFVRHTSASLLIQENADADVRRDLQSFFERVAPWAEGAYRHSTEGPDDMPAHIRSALTQTSLSIPVADRAMALGTWQGIYLFEHRARPHDREVALHLIGA